MDKPFLMNKKSFLYAPNTPASRKVMGVDGIEITREQAASLDKDRGNAGYKILTDIVAEDNRRALEAAKAALAEHAGAAPAPKAEPPAPPAEPAEPSLKDLPLSELREMAKKDGGFPDGKDVDKASRRELLALLQP